MVYMKVLSTGTYCGRQPVYVPENQRILSTELELQNSNINLKPLFVLTSL